jgi:hypothetical protein
MLNKSITPHATRTHTYTYKAGGKHRRSGGSKLRISPIPSLVRADGNSRAPGKATSEPGYPEPTQTSRRFAHSDAKRLSFDSRTN